MSVRRRPGPAARSFFEAVYAAVRRIPAGRVATYGQIARLLGAPRGARTVGWALHGNRYGRRVPCHRVVSAAGRCAPGAFFGTPGEQRRRLEAEGVEFALDGRIDLARFRWDGRVARNRPHGRTRR
jgi:methylated-DNA-protein-cysteine methyltransferase-like protein